jgi:hypothetical protein
MYKLIAIIVAGAMLALAAGCPKGETAEAGKSAAAGDSVPVQVSPEEQPNEGPITLEEWQAQEESGLPELEQSETEAIRSKLIELAPKYEFTYHADSDTLTGHGLAEAGLELQMLVDKVSLEARRAKQATGELGLDKLCQWIYSELVPPLPTPASSTPGGNSNQDAESGRRVRSGADSGDSSAANRAPGMRHPEEAIGEWKSLREENPRITTYHDDKYFNFLQVMHDGVAFFKVFRDKQMTSYFEATWEYDQRTGRLDLINDEGLVNMTFTLDFKGDDKDILFTQQPGDYSTVVYSRIGTGYPPEPDPDAPSAGGLKVEKD